MKCPHFGRRGWSHAREHGDHLSEDRSGAGSEVAGSVVTRHDGHDQVVAGGGGDWHQREADGPLAEAARGGRSEGIAGPAATEAKQQTSAEGGSRRGSEPVSRQVLRSERSALSREARRGTSDWFELYVG